jgi:hypothetical protein
MHHKKIACSFMAALAAYASAADSDVHQLTKDTFEEFVKSNDLVLAECKTPIEASLPLHPSLTASFHSLCSLVRSLQGPRPRV